MDKKQRLHLLGVYNYTVILTYVGMLFAFAGIHFVFSNNDRSFILALLCLMIAGVMDMFDGKVASTKKNRTPSEKLFGIQIDSMADIISYGVFPALIVYKLAIGDKQYPVDHPWQARIVICICALYLLSALIRLSYFNVDEMERQNQTSESRHEYRGLPVTSVAIVLPAVFIVSYFMGNSPRRCGRRFCSSSWRFCSSRRSRCSSHTSSESSCSFLLVSLSLPCCSWERRTMFPQKKQNRLSSSKTRRQLRKSNLSVRPSKALTS